MTILHEAGHTIDGVSGSGWTCSSTDSSYACTHPGPLNPASTLPGIEITTHVATSLSATALHLCSVVSYKEDGNVSNNEHCQSMSVATAALANDIFIETTTLTGIGLVPGAPGVYRIDIRNLGPNATTNVISFTDVVPVGITIDGVGPPLSGEWTCQVLGQTVSCERVAGMPVSQWDTVLIYVTLDTALTGTIENCATVNATFDPVSSNNTSCHTDTLPVPGDVDLSLALAAWVPYNATTGAMSYTIMVSNHGPHATSTAVVVTDTLPSGFSVTSFAGSSLWSCNSSAGTYSCTLPGAIASGNFASLQLGVVGPTNIAAPFDNCATVSTGGDINLSNNANCTSSAGQVDLTVTKQLIGPLNFGGSSIYEVTIVNNGDTDIPWGPQLVDPLPPGVWHSSNTVLSGSWDCNTGGGAVVCGWNGTLPVPQGPLGTIRYTVDIPNIDYYSPGSLFESCITAGPIFSDVNTTDNVACTSKRIPWSYELAASMRINGAPYPGGIATVEVNVSNLGTGVPDVPVTIRGTAPSGAKFIGGHGTSWVDESTADSAIFSYSGIASPGELSPLRIDLLFDSTATIGSTTQLCFTVEPADTNLVNGTACQSVTIANAPLCTGHSITPAPIFYSSVFAADVAGLRVSTENFMQDNNGVVFAPGTRASLGSVFQHSKSVTVTSLGSSAQTLEIAPVVGIRNTSVEWQGDGSTAAIRSYLGPTLESGHDALVFDFPTPVNAVAITVSDSQQPLWLQIYDQLSTLSEVFLVPADAQIIGITNPCGGTIGSVHLIPTGDLTVPTGTGYWSVDSVQWAVP